MTILLDLPEHLHQEVEARAAARGVGVKDVLLEAIEAYMSLPREYVPLKERRVYAQSQVRAWCAARGIDYDTLSEEAHDQLVVQIVHEARHALNRGL